MIPSDEAAEHRAAQAAEPAEDGRDEGDEHRSLSPIVGVTTPVWATSRIAAVAGEHAAERERGRDHAVAR